MRREWLDAVAAINRPMPWTPQTWAVWAVLTRHRIRCQSNGFGTGLQGCADCQRGDVGADDHGMAVWGWHESLAMRVLAADSSVNLVAVVAASLVGEWSLRRRHRKGHTVAV